MNIHILKMRLRHVSKAYVRHVTYLKRYNPSLPMHSELANNGSAPSKHKWCNQMRAESVYPGKTLRCKS